MENVIEVSIATLEQDISAMQEHLNSIKNEMKEINSLIVSLDSMWESTSKQVYRAQLKRDWETLEDMRGNVEEVLKSIQNAKRSYEKCEYNVYQKIGEIRI